MSFRCYSAEDFAGVFAWYQRAADGNLAWAQYNLGLMYRKGEGVAESDADAAYWYRLADAQGVRGGSAEAGGYAGSGPGGCAELCAGGGLVSEGGRAGECGGAVPAGHLYEMGLGAEQDYTAYREWTRKAAMLGQ